MPVCPGQVQTSGEMVLPATCPCRGRSRTAAQLPWGLLMPLCLAHVPFPHADFAPYPFPVKNLCCEHVSVLGPSGQSVDLGVVWGPSTHVSPSLSWSPLRLYSSSWHPAGRAFGLSCRCSISEALLRTALTVNRAGGGGVLIISSLLPVSVCLPLLPCASDTGSHLLHKPLCLVGQSSPRDLP